MHQDLHRFRHCPACRTGALALHLGKALVCDACGFRYFHNTAAAVAAVICCGEELLLARRAFEPGAGLLDFPGGFVDPEESLEAAVAREVAEELGLVLPAGELVYLFSSSNRYPFEETVYRTCDAFFGIRLQERPWLSPRDDVSDSVWVKPGDPGRAELAFPVHLHALARLQSGLLARLPVSRSRPGGIDPPGTSMT